MARERLKRQLRALSERRQQQFDGEPARDETFARWLRRQPVRTQRAILGAERFRLWQEGKITLTKLTDQRHRPLTLEQLQERRTR